MSASSSTGCRSSRGPRRPRRAYASGSSSRRGRRACRGTPESARRGSADDPPPGARLEPALIAGHRLELADRHRGFLQRLTRFARLTAPEPEGLGLPERFVAVGGGASVEGETVDLDGCEPEAAFAVLGRSRGYVGPYGPGAFLAVLLGLPAVAIGDELDEVARNDVRVATDFLHRPTFGRLRVIGVDEAGRAGELLLVRAE